jgi:hypothetical protein
MIQPQPKCGRLHLARILGGWHRGIRKRDKKVQSNVRHDSQQTGTCLTSIKEIHICKSSCGLLAAKGRSQSDQNNGHGKFGQLRRQIVSPNSRYKHCKNTLEQHHKQQKAKYMCLDIKNFYLTAALKYFEYMNIPFAFFPSWIVEQYNLAKHQKDG